MVVLGDPTQYSVAEADVTYCADMPVRKSDYPPTQHQRQTNLSYTGVFAFILSNSLLRWLG